MIVERVKSIVLLILVSLSLFLTYQLWYGQKPTQLIVEEIYERVVMEKPRPLVEVVTPAKIVFRSERGRYLLKESDPGFHLLWALLSQELQEVKNDSIYEGSIPMEGSRYLLTVYMNPALPVGQGMPWLPEAAQALVSEIQLYAINNQIWLFMTGPDLDLKLNILMSGEKVELLGAILTEIAGEQYSIYSALTNDKLTGTIKREIVAMGSIYLPQDPVYMDSLILKPETIDRDFILRSFFIDYSLARIIEEKDGGLIYTDGERGLRLTNVGIEYSYPRLETGQTNISYPDALINSSNLISYHGGWPANLRLDDLVIIGRGRSAPYVAVWRMFHKGYPIYTYIPTRAIFNDRGLIHYTRTLFLVEEFTFESEEQQPVAEWSIALNAAIDLFDTSNPDRESGLQLEAMGLGYAVKRFFNTYRGEPVWFIQIDGIKYYLDAYDLVPLSEEDMI